MSVVQGVVKRLSKSAIVGGAATVVSLGTLAFMVQGMSMTPQAANAPSLGVGVLVQFFGNRLFVFEAVDRKPASQMVPFIVVEALAFFLNVKLFNFLIAHTSIHYAAIRVLGTFVVFSLFSFPLWHWVFRKGPELTAIAD